MKRAFTLIELLIVIAIIALMSVLAIPAFDNYGAKANLDAKAEEIQAFIRGAYESSKSPVLGTNGLKLFMAPGSTSAKVSFKNGKLPVDCILATGKLGSCSFAPLDEQFVFINGSSSVKPEYTLDRVGGEVTILFNSPGGDGQVRFFNGDTEIPGPIQFFLKYEAKTLSQYKVITITKEPFNVEVTDAPISST